MLGMRHMQVFLLFLNITVLYISRLNIGVAVVAMTNAATTNPDFDSVREQWQIIFIIAATIFFFGNLAYITWGTALPQPWDAEDFLKPKEAESSTSNKDRQGTTKVDTKSS
ncbi:hypothetical protein DOY81_001706 [Sarcophaga bullata]|nr:hypothetical protein DOY81_001706 [Sarcophaga bullata]